MPIDRARIQTNGWGQGSFFTPEDSHRLLAQHGGHIRERFDQQTAGLILASHVCDVLAYGDHEPDATVYPVLQLRAGDTFVPSAVRRPRAWHFEMRVDGQVVRRELLARTAFPVPRGDLETLAPWAGARLEPRYAREFPQWLSVRWNRPAFPDGFNDRLSAIQPAIKNEIRRIAQLIQAVLIDIDPDDETPERELAPYEITLCILMKDQDYQDAERRERVEAALDRILELFRGCRLRDGLPAFALRDGECAVRSTARMSVAEYDEFDSFGYEEMSFRDGGDLPPERR